MKNLVLVFIFAHISQCIAGKNLSGDSYTAWSDYKARYKLNFNKLEDSMRQTIFEKNLAFIRHHNAKNAEFTVSLNNLAHLKSDEISTGLKTKQKTVIVQKNKELVILGNSHSNKSVDWRKGDFIPPVRNQQNCGASYAMATADSLQSNSAIKGKKVKDLSAQVLIDCSFNEGNNGCSGGFPDYVYEYAMQKGLPKASDYPYTGKVEDCRENKFKPECFVSSFVNIERGNEHQLVEAIGKGFTVVVEIDASSNEFKFYNNGVFVLPCCSSDEPNHAALAVGYVLDTPIPYLIVKNSWGTGWGENGYVKMPLFKDNQCGIATDASYPIPRLN